MYISSLPRRVRAAGLKGRLLAGSAAMLFAVWAGQACAQTQAEELQSKINRLERDLQGMKNQLQGVVQQQKAQKKAADSGVKVSTSGGIKVESKDGNFVGQVGGRVLIDQAFYDQDQTRLGDGAEFRSLRLEAWGKAYRDWIYKVQADFGGNGAALKDTYFGYSRKPGEVVVGNILVPISLDALISSKYTTFMEPALPQQTISDRRIGVQGAARGNAWTATLGVFSNGVSSTDSTRTEGDGSFEIAGRATYAPVMNKNMVVHVGVGVANEVPQSDSLRYRARPESHVTSARLIDTGTLSNVDNAVTVQPEIAAVFGPFSVQGEYQHLTVNRTGSDDLTFNGWYAQASYFLTGESRPYQINDAPYSADFGRVKPKHNLMDGGPGAWEIAVRYSTLDLTDGTVRGGSERDITLGLNWYATPNVRFMFNYVKVNTDNDASGNSARALPGKSGSGDDPSIFEARAQIDF